MKAKRIITALFAAALTALVLSVCAYAQESAESGTWGGVDWTLADDGTLTISPTDGEPVADNNCGKTYEVGAWREAVRYDKTGEGVAVEGWPYDRSKVKKLIIEDGVTSIGSFTAQGYTNLTGEVIIPATVTYIGQEAFQKSTFTKLTFAEGGSEELCIAQGAFKNLIITEVALPADRPVHLHAWVFNNCHDLKKATLPATLVSVHGTNHIDYFKDFNAHSNPTWTRSSEIFAYNENMEEIEFGSEEVKDMFFASNNGNNLDYIAVTTDTGAFSDLQSAIDAVEEGGTVTLLKNMALSKTVIIDNDKSFTLNGNGKTITNKGATNAAILVGNTGVFSDPDVSAPVYTIKNLKFNGWSTDHVIRCQGVNAVIDGCTFTSCTCPNVAFGIITLNYTNATVKNCTFTNNACAKVLDVNYNASDSKSDVVVEGCTFDGNECAGPAIVLVMAGNSNELLDCEFVNNKVTSTINGATVYFGARTGIRVNGNYFEGNEVDIASTASYEARPYQSASAVFACFKGDDCEMSGNAFIDNVLKLDDGAESEKPVAYSAYFVAGNLSGNYWNKTSAPVEGEDYSHEHSDKYPVIILDYYTEIDKDANGFTLGGIKYNLTDIELDFVDVTETDAEGEKVYNINITAPGKIINRLNSVDLTFELANSFGKTAYEIIASNEEVAINPVNNSDDRYEFHYDGKTDVDTDTAETITIGQVKFTGYGKFSFAVKTADTNAAHATTNDDNIVDTFVPGGNTELDYGNFDVSDDDITDILIEVPARALTINLTFPNAIENKISEYQQMKVTVSGGDLDAEVVTELGSTPVIPTVATDVKPDALVAADFADGAYTVTVTDLLTVNTAYTVTVEGAGYRTYRYTVTMTDDKTLNFWNNVKDNETTVEEGKKTEKVTYLAGDIVKDSLINIYDLSAVVSYFGETGLVGTNNTYAKYDLNRDGKIDSKDVAYVLVSWGK